MRTRILFLDADGVLHPSPPHSGLTRLCWLPQLAEMLRPHDDIGVVLHSSWRFDMPATFLSQLFGELGEQYLGVTRGEGRYESVLNWLREHPEVSSHLILDDMPAQFPTPVPAQLVVCPGREGLTHPDVQRALRDWLS